MQRSGKGARWRPEHANREAIDQSLYVDAHYISLRCPAWPGPLEASGGDLLAAILDGAPAVLYNHPTGDRVTSAKWKFIEGRDALQWPPYARVLTELGYCVVHRCLELRRASRPHRERAIQGGALARSGALGDDGLR